MSNECRHKRSLLIPWFPGDVWVCRDCGEQIHSFHVDGIRDYYLPGDPYWRRKAAVTKWKWLRGHMDYLSLYQCPECCFVGTVDDFDCLGADDGNLFCNQCGAEFVEEEENEPQVTQKQLSG